MTARAHVISAWPLSELAIQRLGEVADRIDKLVERVEDISDKHPSREDLARRLQDADALITSPMVTRIDADMIRGASRLKIVATVSVGYDNVDLRACVERGVKVGNTPGVIAPATADIGMALMLVTMRGIISGVEFVRADRWKTETHPYGNALNNKTLGIFGMGAVGAALAHRARAAGMHIIYYNRNLRSDIDPTEATYVSFDELLQRADVVAVTAPLTPQTRGIFDAGAFAKMKPGAYFINVARGGLVQTDALYEALRSGHLASAGLDVTDPEPMRANHPLLTLPNVVVIPHMGTSAHETRDEMLQVAVSNVLAALRNQPLPAPVD
ncbi:MAG: 2-hydroxyacid dehydrogenase, partial [Vulcanimicrobiaceae bacterium]